jgi:hypothetical protein
MAYVADVAVYDNATLPILFVRVRNYPDMSRELALELWQDELEFIPNLPRKLDYFLLVSQDKSYLWVMALNKEEPVLEFSIVPILKRYSPGINMERRLDRIEIEVDLSSWLNDLASDKVDLAQEPEKTLAQYGFIEAIKNANTRRYVEGYGGDYLRRI